MSGCIEAFVTPSPLPTWARIGIGILAEATFLAYVFVLGRRAVARGFTGDLDPIPSSTTGSRARPERPDLHGAPARCPHRRPRALRAR